MMEKKSMSVMEMGDLLGLKKTDSYYLVHKKLFDVIEVNGVTRIMIDSFEVWYKEQTHYKKVNR